MAGASTPFGEVLRRFRLAAELTQEELAERAGLSVRGISDLERGAKHLPRRATLQLLIEALQLSEADRDAFQSAARRTAVQSAPSTPTPPHLPPQPTPFIGRAHEVAVVCELLRRPTTRLLTLSGPGGIGKTRLAIQAATTMIQQHAADVRVVELAAVGEPNLLLSAIAQEFGVQEMGGQPLRQTLQAAVQDKQLLLVLDNFEHLLAAGPRLAELLDECPRLSMLVTSRSVLRLAREHVFEVPPLAAPDLRMLPDLETISQFDAVQLFCEQARAARADFALSPSNAGAVVEICQRLDGLPLAIELAAARARLFAPAALLARLSNQLGLLSGGARDVAPRHQTLRRAIDWSYELLDEGEQLLFERLAVFVGGGTFEAVQAVCARDDLGVDVVDGLASLVDHSLVRQADAFESDPRFGMLQTIREYALERLATSGQSDALRKRHAAYFLELAESAEPHLRGAQQAEWLARLEREHDNLRSALRWCLQERDAEKALRFGAALRRFWTTHGHVTEGRELLDRALELAGTEIGSESLRAVWAAALNGAGALSISQGEYAVAGMQFEASLNIRRSLGDQPAVALGLGNLGIAAVAQGDYAKARSLFDESLAISRELGNANGTAFALHNLAEVASFEGDYALAHTQYGDSLSLWRDVGNQRGIGDALTGLGRASTHLRDFIRARSLLAESMSIHRELANPGGIAACLDGFAELAATQGQAIRALRLASAAEALRASVRVRCLPAERQRLERAIQPARQVLSTQAIAAAWAEGAAMSFEDTISHALADAVATPPSDKLVSQPRAEKRSAGRLTLREQEVAALVAQGLTNRQIAEALSIGERTVDTHVEHILNKLGLRARAQIGAWATEHGLSINEA